MAANASDPAGPSRPATLLLVEDSAPDVQIVRRVLRDGGRPLHLAVARDGQEGLDYLLRQGKFQGGADWRRPDLVLTDLNLPRLTGRDLVARLRADPALHGLPVVVWTTSRRPEDVRAAYAAGANSYVEKPRDFARLQAVLQAVLSYWLDTALLPSLPDGPRPS